MLLVTPNSPHSMCKGHPEGFNTKSTAKWLSLGLRVESLSHQRGQDRKGLRGPHQPPALGPDKDRAFLSLNFLICKMELTPSGSEDWHKGGLDAMTEGECLAIPGRQQGPGRAYTHHRHQSM